MDDNVRKLLCEYVEILGNKCWYDHHGYCQEHFMEKDCLIARTIKLLEEDNNKTI